MPGVADTSASRVDRLYHADHWDIHHHYGDEGARDEDDISQNDPQDRNNDEFEPHQEEEVSLLEDGRAGRDRSEESSAENEEGLGEAGGDGEDEHDEGVRSLPFKNIFTGRTYMYHPIISGE